MPSSFDSFQDKTDKQLKDRLRELKQIPHLNQSQSWEYEQIDQELRDRREHQANRMF